ncbi:hypothetical protein [Vogesella sp. LIG4]|uniref:hypothetical protein n=1 Tax=Vogesella sp. LIG4 TaxID=1192162 RepID=UPI0012FDF9D1|nr:hypothetical protein [Vogesella sp. LIG4]
MPFEFRRKSAAVDANQIAQAASVHAIFATMPCLDPTRFSIIVLDDRTIKTGNVGRTGTGINICKKLSRCSQLSIV